MSRDGAGEVEQSDLLSHDPPGITTAHAAQIARDIFGVEGVLTRLTAEKDANFCIRPAAERAMVLKITNAAEDRGVTEMQTGALVHLAHVDPSLPVPRVRPTLSGATSQIIMGPDGKTHVVRLLSYLEGTVLSTVVAGRGLHRDIGALLARLTLGLRGYDHPSARHALLWDIRQAGGLWAMLGAVEDDGLRRRLAALLDRFDEEIAPRLAQLPAQVVHNDFNPHNLLVDGARLRGIIDFGDMVHTPVVCDLAVACSYQITEGEHPLAHISEMIGGFSGALRLSEEEVDLLPDLMRLRHAASLVIGAWRAARYPGNAGYILRNAQVSRRGLAVLDRIGDGAARDTLQQAARRVLE